MLRGFGFLCGMNQDYEINVMLRGFGFLCGMNQNYEINVMLRGFGFLCGMNQNYEINTQSKASQKHNNFIFKYVNNNKATSFDLQSHHQAILNHISIVILKFKLYVYQPQVFVV